MEPLVSILIPAYNAEKWIGETLDSAVGQTWRKKEIIVVDDGSTDSTLCVARRFASASVKVVTQPNQGAAAARNKAFSLCQGGYIQWLDADDILAVDKVEMHVRGLDRCQNERTLLSSPWGRFYYRVSRARFIPTALWCDLTPVEWLMRKMEMTLHMQPATWLVSRELTEAAGPWDTRLVVDDDGEYFCRVILASNGIRFIPEPKTYYRMSGSGSLSYIGQSNKKLDAQFLSLQLHIGYLRSLEDTERARAACVRCLQAWMLCFYPERPDIVKRARELAADLGGELETPRLPWKYAWIQRLLGWKTAKLAGRRYNAVKSSVIRHWDKALYHWECGVPAAGLTAKKAGVDEPQSFNARISSKSGILHEHT